MFPSFRRIGDETPEQRRARLQSENLKWQQEMFHRILHMIGLHKEEIVSEQQLSATRSELLGTLIASPAEGEWPAITRDKLLFLQELLYANCISEEDYHMSKRPLLLRLAVQGAEIDSRDVLLGGRPSVCPPVTVRTEPITMQPEPESSINQETEWSVVEFKEDQTLLKNFPVSSTEDHSKQKSPMKQVIGAISRLTLSPYKGGKSKDKNPSVIVPQSTDFQISQESCPIRNPPTLPMQEGYKVPSLYINPTESFKENPFWQVAGLIDAPEQTEKKTSEETALLGQPSAPVHKRGATRAKVKKAFNQLFLKGQRDHSKESEPELPYASHLSDSDSDNDDLQLKKVKKPWGMDLFKSSKKMDTNEETAYLPLNGSSEEALSPSKLVQNPIGEGPNTKKIKKKLHSNGAATDFFIDKVLGENIKNELSRIRAEMNTTNPSSTFTNEQIEAIATRLPVDKNELKKFFPKSWCDRYGDIVLDVVQKEFKDHVGEMDNLRKTAREKRNSAARRRGLEDDENCSPSIHHEARKTDNSKGATPKEVFTTQDENSQSNLCSPLSTTKSQQPNAPSPFHQPKSHFQAHQAKSPSPFSPVKHNPQSPSFYNQSVKSPYSIQDENSEPNLTSPLSAIKSQQPNAPSSFHQPKSPFPFSQAHEAKSPSSFSPVNHNRQSPSFYNQSVKSPYSTQDENSEPNLNAPSAFKGQQPKSSSPFHPMPKPPFPFSQAHQVKSPSPVSPVVNHDPRSPFVNKQSPNSPSSTRERKQSKSPSPFLQETHFQSVARSLFTEMS